MAKSTPFYSLKFHQPPVDNQSKIRRQVYFRHGIFLNYILRNEATYNFPVTEDELKELKILKTEALEKYGELQLKHPSLEKKTLEEFAFSKYNEKRNEFRFEHEAEVNTGLYDFNGLVSKEKLKEKRKSFKNIKDEQNVWTGVFSFDKEFAELNKIYSPDKVHEIFVKRMKLFLVHEMLDPNNIEFAFSFHVNTNNPHIHFYYFEKEPTFVSKENGKTTFNFKFKGLFDKRNLRHFKNQVYQDIWKAEMKEPLENLYNTRQDLMSSVKFDFEDVKDIFKDIKSFNEINDQKYKNILKNFNKLNWPKKQKFGSRKVSENKREELFNLTLETLELFPDSFNKFQKLNEKALEIAELKFQNYLSNLDDVDTFGETTLDIKKFYEDNQEDIDLNLTEEEKKWNYHFEKEDPVEFLKAKKNWFYNEQLISINPTTGYFQGSIPTIANILLESLPRLEIPKKVAKQNLDYYENLNRKINKSKKGKTAKSS